MQAVTQHTSQAWLLSVQGKNRTPEHIQQASFLLLKISTTAESPGDQAHNTPPTQCLHTRTVTEQECEIGTNRGSGAVFDHRPSDL